MSLNSIGHPMFFGQRVDDVLGALDLSLGDLDPNVLEDIRELATCCRCSRHLGPVRFAERALSAAPVGLDSTGGRG